MASAIWLQAVVVLVEEQDVVDLGRLGLAGDREDGLLADVLGLVATRLRRLKMISMIEEVADLLGFRLAFLDQVGEDHVED